MIAIAIFASSAPACVHGWDSVFPVNDEQMLAAGTADFGRELFRLGMKITERPGVRYPWRDKPVPNDLEGEVEDLEAALAEAKTPADKRKWLVHRYRAFRQTMRAVAEKPLREPLNTQWPAGVPREVPDGLPAEFALYLKGALAYQLFDYDEAREHWLKLLELPAQQRKYRSVWAAYMMGRSYVYGGEEGDPQRVVEWMKWTRELAEAEYADSQNLSEASYGWEARAELDRRNFERAFALYWDQQDAPSLAETAQAAFRGSRSELQRLARDPLSVKVMTCLVVARGGPWRPMLTPQQVSAWLAALEETGQAKLDNADRIAWGAYQHGKIPAARRWLARAKQDSLLARWLRAKLLLVDGKPEEAARVLAGLVRDWPRNDTWRGGWGGESYPADTIAGELSMLQLASGKYVESMDLLLRFGFLEEGAYVAERVLTVDELKSYVDRQWSGMASRPENPERAERYWGYGPNRGGTPFQVERGIRHLLGRRLVRLGRAEEARGYFPEPHLGELEAYLAALASSRDMTLSADERGAMLWQAAKLARRHGMEIMGTEIEPDHASSGGAFGDWEETHSIPWRMRNAAERSKLAPVSDDEGRRVMKHHPEPDRRFHYRFIAAQHAWDAARMLPDESDLKARVLCTAGNWLAAQYPRDAERFYKALVQECGTTKLGRSARKLTWLPATPK